MAASFPVDVIIRGGRVIDPGNKIFDQIYDVAIADGRIVAVGEQLKCPCVAEYNAAGCIVCPGLVDSHVHCYQSSTPLGVNADETCLARGVTTVVDAGSAGASTFLGLKRNVIDKCKTRVLALLHISTIGLAKAGCAGFGAGGECDTLEDIDVAGCVKCVQAYPDDIVGIKVRLTADVANQGMNEAEAYRRSLEASHMTGLPLMVHHSFSTIPTLSDDSGEEKLCCPGSLRKGDIYTHCFHGYPQTIIDSTSGKIHPDVTAARKRGIYFDIGHGQGSFSWTVTEMCVKQNFWPDTLGSDLHTGNSNGPVYDLPAIMSKLLACGMPLENVIEAVTYTPAKMIGRDHVIGSLSVGHEADITVLKLENCDFALEDSQGQLRRMKRLIKPVAVWRAGVQYPIKTLNEFPNMKKWSFLAKPWDQLVIRDDVSPKVE